MKRVRNIGTCSTNNAATIKGMLDASNEIIANINSLDGKLSDLIMELTLQQKVDSEANTEWQKYMGSSAEILTFNR